MIKKYSSIRLLRFVFGCLILLMFCLYGFGKLEARINFKNKIGIVIEDQFMLEFKYNNTNTFEELAKYLVNTKDDVQIDMIPASRFYKMYIDDEYDFLIDLTNQHNLFDSTKIMLPISYKEEIYLRDNLNRLNRIGYVHAPHSGMIREDEVWLEFDSYHSLLKDFNSGNLDGVFTRSMFFNNVTEFYSVRDSTITDDERTVSHSINLVIPNKNTYFVRLIKERLSAIPKNILDSINNKIYGNSSIKSILEGKGVKFPRSITLAVVGLEAPFFYYKNSVEDAKEDARGYAIKLFKLMSYAVGFDLNFIYVDDYERAQEYLNKGTVDVIVVLEPEGVEEKNLIKVRLLEDEPLLVFNKEVSDFYSKSKNYTVGYSNMFLKDIVHGMGKSYSYRYYDTYKDVFTAIKRNNINFAIIPRYVFMFYNNRYESIVSIPISNFNGTILELNAITNDISLSNFINEANLLINYKDSSYINEIWIESIPLKSEFADKLFSSNIINIIILLFFIIVIPYIMYRYVKYKRLRTYNFLQFFEDVPTPIVVLDSEMIVFKINRAFSYLFGVSETKALGVKFLEWISISEERNFNMMIGMIDLRGSDNREINLSKGLVKNNEQIPTLITGKRVNIDNKIYYLLVIVDTSAQKLAREDIIKARNRELEYTKAKQSFLARISHELRTPINAIMGYGHLALDTDLEKTKDYITKIISSGDHLRAIVNDILDFSRIEAGKISLSKKSFNLYDLGNEVVDILKSQAAEKKIQLFVDTAEDKSFENLVVIGDYDRYRQILINLVGNAIKFTDCGFVKIRFSIIETRGDSIIVQASVIDSGIGIDLLDQDKLFDSFYQAGKDKEKAKLGAGLGLSISKKLVELLDGKIKVTSTLNVGSQFIVEIPFFIGKEANILKDEVKSVNCDSYRNSIAQFCNGKKILVTDDNDMNREIAVGFIQGLGLEIHETCNGQEAVDLINKIDFDLVLMDIEMPVLDGIEAVKIIRSQGFSTKIIAMTAYSIDEQGEEIMKAGFDNIITKPFVPKDLYRIIFNNLKK